MSAETVDTVTKAGSRCTAVCTSNFTAEEKRCVLLCPVFKLVSCECASIRLCQFWSSDVVTIPAMQR